VLESEVRCPMKAVTTSSESISPSAQGESEVKHISGSQPSAVTLTIPSHEEGQQPSPTILDDPVDLHSDESSDSAEFLNRCKGQDSSRESNLLHRRGHPLALRHLDVGSDEGGSPPDSTENASVSDKLNIPHPKKTASARFADTSSDESSEEIIDVLKHGDGELRRSSSKSMKSCLKPSTPPGSASRRTSDGYDVSGSSSPKKAQRMSVRWDAVPSVYFPEYDDHSRSSPESLAETMMTKSGMRSFSQNWGLPVHSKVSERSVADPRDVEKEDTKVGEEDDSNADISRKMSFVAEFDDVVEHEQRTPMKKRPSWVTSPAEFFVDLESIREPALPLLNIVKPVFSSGRRRSSVGPVNSSDAVNKKRKGLFKLPQFLTQTSKVLSSSLSSGSGSKQSAGVSVGRRSIYGNLNPTQKLGGENSDDGNESDGMIGLDEDMEDVLEGLEDFKRKEVEIHKNPDAETKYSMPSEDRGETYSEYTESSSSDASNSVTVSDSGEYYEDGHDDDFMRMHSTLL